MDVAELRRIVGADRKQREFGIKPSSDLAEAREIGCVARVVDRVFARLQHESAITAMRIFQNARAPVARWDVRDRQRSPARTLPPIEFDDFRKSEIGYQIGHVRRNNNGGRYPACPQIILHNRPQRRTMQMIEVRVRNQYQIDGRKVGDAKAGTAQALEHKEPAREIRIDHYALAADLHEETGMANECHAER